MFSLFLCFPLLALIFVYLVITLPVFHPVSTSTVQSGPNLIASLKPFVLGRATGEQLLNVVHMVPGRLSWMHYQALKRRSCCTERLAMCELMSLSNPSYLKVLISALFHFVAISWDTTDAFCLLRRSKMIFIVSDPSFLKFSSCALFWESIQSNESISLQSKTNILPHSCNSDRSFEILYFTKYTDWQHILRESKD